MEFLLHYCCLAIKQRNINLVLEQNIETITGKISQTGNHKICWVGPQKWVKQDIFYGALPQVYFDNSNLKLFYKIFE